ncbi:MAG: hypothetical protein JWN40_3382 [Phycisphaerales bacterium]|nr:hypothetical protein [Phycisphaerales bacterium]
MSAIATEHVHRTPDLTPQTALRYAWWVYLTMLVLPFLMFLYVASSLMGETGVERRDRPLADGWFIASVVYMVVIAPASFFVRSRFFRDYWTGKCVAPRQYLKGMIVVWATLEIGGLLSLFGCLMSRSLLPGLLPAMAAFVMYVVLWPNGRAMICGARGASDDPEKYEEPR